MSTEQLYTIRVYELEPRDKHATIFAYFDRLAPGESFIIENDHDPAPLFYQLRAERNDHLDAFEYLERGPDLWKVRISRTTAASDVGQSCTVPVATAALSEIQSDACSVPPRVAVLDVTALPPRLKHPTIFEWFNRLAEGSSFVISNDHDPKPLYYQMLGELGPVFTWNYLEEGPSTWKVSIRKNPADESTIGQLAAKDARKAEAMKKMGIDFCCGGGKTVSQAAAEAGITTDMLYQQLAAAEQVVTNTSNAFDRWDADFLADYIYNQHHKYYYGNREVLLQLSTKVKAVHKDSHPELTDIAALVKKLFDELDAHFIKEEQVIFPYIKALAHSVKTGVLPAVAISMTDGSLAMMHMEHEAAGDLLRQLRALADDYKLPEGACNSYRLLYSKLQELEQDLHQHIHLENNILFPKALQLEKELAIAQ